MTFTQEQLEQINKWASIYLPISDMALMLDIPAEMLRDEIRNKHTCVMKYATSIRRSRWHTTGARLPPV